VSRQRSEEIFSEQTKKPKNPNQSDGVEVAVDKIDPIKSGAGAKGGVDFQPELNLQDWKTY
jgi:hypothetical protein